MADKRKPTDEAVIYDLVGWGRREQWMLGHLRQAATKLDEAQRNLRPCIDAILESIDQIDRDLGDSRSGRGG